MPDALTSTGGRRSAGVRSSAWTRAPVAASRLERSSAIRRGVHGQLPMLAPARLTTPCAPDSSFTQSPSAERASQVTKRTPAGGGFVFPPRLSTTTSWPSVTRLIRRRRPMKPDPPAIRIFILLVSSAAAVVTAIGPAPDYAGLRPEAACPAFRASLAQALRGQGQQRGAIELPTLAGGHAGVARQTHVVAVGTGGVWMLLQARAEPVRLPHRNRAIGLRDDEAEPAVFDAGKGIDLPGL